MPLYRESQERYLNDAAKTGAAIRNLSLSGLGALWLITHPSVLETTQKAGHPLAFKLAALFFILALTADLFHSFFTSVAYWFYLENIKKTHQQNLTDLFSKDFDLTTSTKYIPWVFYILKGLSLTSGGVVLVYAMATYRF